MFTGISKLHTYKSHYIDIKSNIEDLEIHCLYFDSFIPGFETEQLIKNLHKSKDQFHSTCLDRQYKLFSNVKKKLLRKCKLEILESFWIYKLSLLGAKSYSIECSFDIKKTNSRLKENVFFKKILVKPYNKSLFRKGEC